jgi:hypothetical protein
MDSLPGKLVIMKCVGGKIQEGESFIVRIVKETLCN